MPARLIRTGMQSWFVHGREEVYPGHFCLSRHINVRANKKTEELESSSVRSSWFSIELEVQSQGELPKSSFVARVAGHDGRSGQTPQSTLLAHHRKRAPKPGGIVQVAAIGRSVV